VAPFDRKRWHGRTEISTASSKWMAKLWRRIFILFFIPAHKPTFSTIFFLLGAADDTPDYPVSDFGAQQAFFTPSLSTVRLASPNPVTRNESIHRQL